MNPFYFAAMLSLCMFFAMVVLFEIGRGVAIRKHKRELEKAQFGTGVVDGAVFGLLGLLVAFTFSGAANRFDARRDLVIEEANDIGTAWLRIDLLPDDRQPAMRDLFRKYLDARLEVYRDLNDREKTELSLGNVSDLQQQIWDLAIVSTNEHKDLRAANLLLPALNAMFDITTKRTAVRHMHPPNVIFVLLGVIILVSSLLAGYGMGNSAKRPWLHVICFSLIMSVSFYLILDLEYPRLGLIRVDAIDHVLKDLRDSMN